MVIDEFLIAIGVKADTRPLDETKKGLANVEDQAKNTDTTISRFSSKLGGFFKNFATFGLATFTAIKTTLMGAWSYLDSTIDRVEELHDSQDATIRTTKEQVEMAKKYRENMDRMGKTIEDVKTKVALGFLPTMYALSEQYTKFLDENKELIADGISKLLEWVSRASQVLTNFIRFIDKAVTSTIGWKKALYVLAAAFIFIKRAMLAAFITNPIAWVVAALAGLMLLIDDFMTYLDGGESQFGEFWGAMLKWIKDNQDAINSIIDFFKKFGAIALNVLSFLGAALWDVLKIFANVWNLIASIFEGNTDNIEKYWSQLMDAIGSLLTNLGGVFQIILDGILVIFKAIFDAAKDYVIGVFASIVSAVSGFVSSIGQALSSVYEAVTAPFRQAFDWIVEQFSKLPSLIGGVVSKLTFGLSDKVGAAVSNVRNSVVNNNSSTNATINVTSPNPTMAASQTVNTLNKVTRSNVISGVKA